MKSSVTSKLTQLINDEAMKQLAENYHELLPKLIKVDIDHIEEDLSYAVGACYFMLSGRIIFAPVIYREGSVDSISYIGDTENETLYGLTKKMYKRLISSSKSEFGRAITEKEQERLMIDKGIIGRLFATPTTISPKVAGDDDYEDNMMIEMLENPVFAASFTKLASIPAYKDVLDRAYSLRVFEKLASVNAMTKVASIVREDDGSMIFHKIADLNSLPAPKRAEAAKAIATEGFYKVAEDKSPTKAALLKVPKIGEMLLKGKSRMEILTEPGIYNAVSKTLDLVPVVVAKDGGSLRNSLYYGRSQVTVRKGDQPAGSKKYGTSGSPIKQFIGLQAGALNDDPREHIVRVFGKEAKPVDAGKIALIAGREDIEIWSISNVTKVGNEIVVDVWSSDRDTTIVIGQAHSYTKSSSTIYVHPNHALFLASRKDDNGISSASDENKGTALANLMTSDDMDRELVKTASFDVSYSAGSYHYGGNRLSKAELTQSLRETGYDNESITTITKTANAAGGMPVDFNEVSLTLKAILAELSESKSLLVDMKSAVMASQGETSRQEQAQEVGTAEMGAQGQIQGSEEAGGGVTQQIMELAASVGADGQAVLAAGQQQGMDEATILATLQQEIQQYQAQQPQVAEGQGSPMEQDMNAQAQMQQDPNAQMQDPSQGLDERTQQDLQQQGFNPQMTPEMLDQLQQIADKDVLNASIISYLVDTPDAKAVTGQYIEDITRGVNGLARTLLLVEIQRTSFNDQIGDKQLNTFLSRGKTLLNRMTDFVIDISVID